MIRLAPNPLRHLRTCSYSSCSEANSIDDIVKIAPVNLTSITEVYLVCRTCRDTLYMIVTILWWSLHRVAGTSATFRLFWDINRSEGSSSTGFVAKYGGFYRLPMKYFGCGRNDHPLPE